MRQDQKRRRRVIQTRFIGLLALILVFLIQPLAGCTGENPATAPTIRIGEPSPSIAPTTAEADQTVNPTAAALMTAATAAAGSPAQNVEPAPSIPPSLEANGAAPSETASSEAAITPSSETTASVQPSAAALSPTPKPTPTRKATAAATPTPRPKTAAATAQPAQPAASPAYYLYCELGSYTIQVYGKDASGNYTVPVRRIRTAIGRGTMTPRGKFKLGGRERWHTFGSGSYAQYAIKYHSSGLYLHSPIYSSRNIRKMEKWSYTAIGTKNTSGCLRMTTGDINWIYRNCPAGTVLEIVAGSPRGLKAPALPALVRSNEDPTDPSLA